MLAAIVACLSASVVDPLALPVRCALQQNAFVVAVHLVVQKALGGYYTLGWEEDATAVAARGVSQCLEWVQVNLH